MRRGPTPDAKSLRSAPLGDSIRYRNILTARSLFVRSLSSARRLAADGGGPGSLRSRRAPHTHGTCYCGHPA